MKTQRIFPGTVLIGFGLYFFLNIPKWKSFQAFIAGPLYYA